jgi:hypothetical protein
MTTVATDKDRYLQTREIAVREIIAFRAWKVMHFPSILMQPPTLVSYSRSYNWQPGVNRAHVMPTRFNQSGFYALKDYNAILDYWGTSDQWYCLGAVELWGEVIEGTLGYRAEFAAVQNLVALVRAKSRPPRVFNGYVTWRRALELAYRQGMVTLDEEAGKLEREYDNDGLLITALRERYLR